MGALFAALVLDAVFGEPRALWSRVPHPTVLMGRAVTWVDRRFNDGTIRAGALAYAALAALALGAGWLLHATFGLVADVLVTAILLAQRSLADHVRATADGLRLSLQEGRRAVGRIVGRDTAQMDAPAVARAAIESAAENLSDGVVAPAFWFAVAGLPGLVLYKMTNTADSMIGYRTPRHEAFGKVAARADDVLNWVPARLTAALFWLLRPAPWAAIASDAGRHRSPNAGWPEAALARVLCVALAGPRRYGGALTVDAFVNASGRRQIGATEVDAAVGAIWRVWAMLSTVVLALALWPG